MGKKRVVYYVDERGRNPVWEHIQSLSAAERNKCLEYIAYLEETGEGVRRPVGDYLGGKLYELRPKTTRILYFFMLRNDAVLVHAFRKTSREVPQSEIHLAHRRMEEFVKRVETGMIDLGG
jgi:phage-related protein